MFLRSRGNFFLLGKTPAALKTWSALNILNFFLLCKSLQQIKEIIFKFENILVVFDYFDYTIKSSVCENIKP